MSNLTENTTTNRSALAPIGNTKPLGAESNADIENNVIKPGMQSAVKNQNESTGSKKKVIMKPKELKEKPDEEAELIKTLKNTLKEAMDENDEVRQSNSFFS